eukprot:3302947-Alexandrium_andersonii.AAC.1
MQNRFRRSKLELRGARYCLEIGPSKLPRGALCAVSRGDSESAHESGPRGGPRPRTRKIANS